MRKMDLLILCVVLISFITNTHGDQDFFTVLRIGGSHPGVQTEYHRLTNVIGLPFRTRNGFFIDSVADMPSLKCSPAIEGCGWTRSSNWIYSPVNVSHDEQLSVNIDYHFNLHGYYETCDDYNGGCEFWCSHHKGLRCMCPNGVSMRTEDMSCTLDPKIKTSGYYDFPSRIRIWYIIPPVNSTTEMNIITGHQYTQMEEVSRVREQTRQSFVSRQHLIIENDNFVRFSYQYGYNNNLVLKGKIDIRRNHLTLNGEQGTLKYEVETLVDSLCISVIYQIQSNFGGVNMRVSLLNGTDVKLNNIQERTRRNWIQKLFYATVGHPNTVIKLNLEVKGQGTTIYSINGCSPYGTQEVTLTKLLSSVPNKVYSLLPTKNNGNY